MFDYIIYLAQTKKTSKTIQNIKKNEIILSHLLKKRNSCVTLYNITQHKRGEKAMFFEQENIGFMILDVVELSYDKCTIYNVNRKYHALSFRFDSNADIEFYSAENKCNKTYHLKENSLTYVPSNTTYTRTASYDKMIVVHFSYFGPECKNIDFFYPKEPQKYIENFKKLLKLWKEKKTAYKMHAASVFYEILADAYSENRPMLTKNHIINDSVQYMFNNYNDPEISIKQLASISYISETYFRRLFKEEYNISPKKYISKLRIKYAAELIVTGYYTLPQVAEMSGFTDYRYFSVEFKRCMGCSPSKYKYNSNIPQKNLLD